jgi:hypothetical protein
MRSPHFDPPFLDPMNFLTSKLSSHALVTQRLMHPSNRDRRSFGSMRLKLYTRIMRQESNTLATTTHSIPGSLLNMERKKSQKKLSDNTFRHTLMPERALR